MNDKSKTKIAIFASGTGSNAKSIIDYSFSSNYKVELIVSNKKNAGVLSFSKYYDIDSLIIDKENFYSDNLIINFLKERDVEIIILAGFLWLIPDYFIKEFKDKIINIHPSLLPKHGGKGMYGAKVHESVFNSSDKKSGITIHLVNEEYDKGKILFQKSIDISEENNPESIAKSVLKLEHIYFPQVIENYIKDFF